jgi:Lon protease-like protein|tara:strand:+ start:141 stop:866 length:726 start_codon:yes stop_codon:yes gene_type:complete
MENLPLFVLPMVLMPGEIQELRVFEPRYRQMLDDCLLDELNFGLVLNDPLQSVNHWDGPRTHGCEAEILHHETKGSNHFLEIIGRRRFTIQQVIEPALPPFSHPMVESLISPDGVDPDLQTLLEIIPEEVGHSKLYISAKVEYHEPQIETTTKQQTELKELVNMVLNRIGIMLEISEDMLGDWVKTTPMLQVIDSDPNSIYSVTALLVNELESRQRVLARDDIDAAIAELAQQLTFFDEEE